MDFMALKDLSILCVLTEATPNNSIEQVLDKVTNQSGKNGGGRAKLPEIWAETARI